MTDVEMILNYRRLRHLRRCNTLPTLKNEDVAQHSYFVAMMAMAIGDEYNTYATEHNVGYHPQDFDNLMDELNMEKVLRKALCHDIEEAFISDIPWNIKHKTAETERLFQIVTDAHMRSMFDGASSTKIQQELNATSKKGLEGEFVDVIDMLELAVYCWEEYSMGNRAMKGLLDKAFKILDQKEFSKVLLNASPLFAELIRVLSSPKTGNLVQETIYNID